MLSSLRNSTCLDLPRVIELPVGILCKRMDCPFYALAASVERRLPEPEVLIPLLSIRRQQLLAEGV